jgi:hypothetical protein
MLILLIALAAAPSQNSETTETLLRAAAYDKNLEARTPEGLRLGVVFDPGIPDAQESAEQFVKLAAAIDSEFAPAWVELVAFESESQLYTWHKEHHVSVLFVPTGMGATLDSIVRACEAAGVLTIADSFTDVEKGLVIGLRFDDGSKKLVVNMAAAERAGVDFDASVRQVAARVGGAPDSAGRDEVAHTLDRYGTAIQERDLDALRGVWPALEGDEEKRIVSSFKMARAHRISFAILQVEDQGTKARARVRRADKLVTRDGQTIVAGTIVEISFQKQGDGGWVIDSMANAGPLS